MRLTKNQVRLLRLMNQQLDFANSEEKVEAPFVVKSICGIQAQDESAAMLGVWARSVELLKSEVQSALYDDHSIVRTWSMRGTLHLINADDLHWLLEFLGPIFIQSSRGRREHLGLSMKTESKAVGLLKELLVDNGNLTRAEIVEKLADRGIKLEGQAAPHLLRLAALQGIICYGAVRNGASTFVLLSDWIDPVSAYNPVNPLSELAIRYLSAFAPATPEDFSTWSGLSLKQAHTAWKQIADLLVEVSWGDSSGWIINKHEAYLKEMDPDPSIIRLLPRYDTYLLGYRDRNLIISSEFAKRIYPGGGLLHPAVILNGIAIAVWNVKHYEERFEVIVDPFEELSSSTRDGLEEQINRLANYFEKKTQFE